MHEADLKKIMDRDDLRIIAGLAREFGVEAFLVGGALRDTLLERETKDLDFALSGAWEEIPRAFAGRIAGSFFWLDEERLQGRVVRKKGDGGISVYDFAPLCGGSIEDDLRRRDFTINALAIALFGDRNGLIDPLRGRGDLSRGVIRACSAAAFDDDPLRLMRAIRFAAELGFSIEAKSWESIRAKAPLLQGVAGERVRDELFRTLAATGCGVSLQRLWVSGLWAQILPAGEWGICEGSIARGEGAERLCTEIGRRFPDCAEKMTSYLDREVEAGIAVWSLIKLAAVMGSGDKGGIAPLAERLRLGKEAGRVLAFLRRDEGSLFEYLGRDPAERAIYRFFRDREPAGPGVLITGRVGGAVSAGCFLTLMGYWLRQYNAGAADLFLTGGEVMEILGVPPGKAVGEAMERLREAEGEGRVSSREEAREFIKNLLTKEEPIG
jgi:poly(A) polymerase